MLTESTRRRSAFPVRMSYRVKVRSDPAEARILDSDQLNLRDVMDSVDVGNVNVDIGADLTRNKMCQWLEVFPFHYNDSLIFVPDMDNIGSSCEEGFRTVMINATSG